jgi:hypothetical protein
MGASGYARRAKFLYPSRAIGYLKLPIDQYELRDHYQSHAKELHDSLNSVVSGPCRRKKILILLPFRYSAAATREKWKRLIADLLINFRDAKIYIKAHPLSENITPIEADYTTMLDKSIPAELLVIFHKFEEIFVEPSTAIHSIKFFAADTQLTAVIHDQQRFFQDKEIFLDSFGITSVRNID